MPPQDDDSLPLPPTGPPRHIKREPNWHRLVPLVYAPLIPLIRIGLNGRVAPATRDAVFFGTVLLALGHAGWVMTSDSSMGAGN
ncbi:hypothetical protein WJX74_000777 [Apatococcus lobatus]|uniref:Uncharacterized protein n=1 Tax=Apatococcus lobatus TaxID=904363 RepID=A0AAW1QCN9_9CHLO